MAGVGGDYDQNTRFAILKELIENEKQLFLHCSKCTKV